MTIGGGVPLDAPDRSQGVEGLVRAAQAGDRSAFAVLYERYARFVHAVLLAHTSPEDVADLVQDTFLKALTAINTLRDPAAFTGWLATIARNTARLEHRGALRLVRLEENIPLKAHDPVGLDAAEVLRAIRSLPEAYSEPLMLRLKEGLSGPEIAEQLGMTHGSVRVNLHRGFEQLREQMRGWR